MISVTPDISIGEQEIQFDYMRASGPGGQHVNKVATAVQLRFDINANTSLSSDIKTRLRKLAGKRVSHGGVLVIRAARFKSRERNRQDALERLLHLIRQAAVRPVKRIKTKPSRKARLRRMEAKRHRSRLKQNRRGVKHDRY